MQDQDIQKLEDEGYEVISLHPLVIKHNNKVMASKSAVRNPDRIPTILHKLEAVWSRVPDWRLGQLLYNLKENIKPSSDLFYLEDDILEFELDKLYQDDHSN
jgi:hypothetical protein